MWPSTLIEWAHSRKPILKDKDHDKKQEDIPTLRARGKAKAKSKSKPKAKSKAKAGAEDALCSGSSEGEESEEALSDSTDDDETCSEQDSYDLNMLYLCTCYSGFYVGRQNLHKRLSEPKDCPDSPCISKHTHTPKIECITS